MNMFCGFKITLFASLFSTLFSWLLGRYKSALAAGLGIALCTLLVEAGPTVVWAALMGGLALLAS